MGAMLIVPGLGGSGPAHWQTWWQDRTPESRRVAQEDWNEPDLERWSRRVGTALDHAEEPAWLVAHSFGCLASVRAGAARPGRVAGALLVAPADPARFGHEALLPHEALPFPTLVVGSENDPWMSLPRAAHWAGVWGGDWVNLGRAGHINAESGFGPWPEGLGLFESFRAHRPGRFRFEYMAQA